jgi:hypothetical protein
MQRYIARSLQIFLLLLASALVFVACGGGDTASTPSAQQLIKNAQAAFQKVTAYHFNLVADNAGAGGFLVVKSADGDVVVPNKLQADAIAQVVGNDVKVKIISLGDKQYVTDPISGKWQATSGLLDPRTLSDSKTGIVAILGDIENPSTPTDSSVDGRACWNTSGKVKAQDIQGITGGGAPANSAVDTTTCIGKSDNLPYQILVKGIAVQGDTAQTVRTFKLSKFNESISIVAPI